MTEPSGSASRCTSAELANRDVLVAELAVLRARLRGEPLEPSAGRLADLRAALDRPSPLDDISRGFGLTGFERSVLLLAAAPELTSAVRSELATATGVGSITFGAALALLPDGHWSAIGPQGPLRRWELIELTEPGSVTGSPLIADEPILHHLVGAGQVDTRVLGICRPIHPPARLPPTLATIADALAEHWRADRPVVLTGPQAGNAFAVAAWAAVGCAVVPLRVPAAELLRRDGSTLLRRMERETVLSRSGWVVDARDESAPDVRRLVTLFAGLDAPLVVVASTDANVDLGASTLQVPRVRPGQRAWLLSEALRDAGVDAGGDAQTVSAVFDLSVDAVADVAAEVAAGHSVWSASRRRSRAGFGGLAQLRTPRATWDDLVLPETQLRQLRSLAAAVRHRHRVLEEWGFADRTARGLGTSALFAGPSGTGKTLAAEVLAGDLGLDLVRVDLSQVVDKYIGESEKHLRKLFEAAEAGGAVLLFDEADVLFGKRSEVRDSHDRYANLEVGYLLQRMEEFRGLALLTTNARSSIDSAFSRRLSAIVSFPYPDPELREQLWRRAFPTRTPTAIDPVALACIDLPGGGIAAAALTAAYLAAADGDIVGQRHVLEAARWELAKSGRTMTLPPTRPRSAAVVR